MYLCSSRVLEAVTGRLVRVQRCSWSLEKDPTRTTPSVTSLSDLHVLHYGVLVGNRLLPTLHTQS